MKIKILKILHFEHQKFDQVLPLQKKQVKSRGNSESG